MHNGTEVDADKVYQIGRGYFVVKLKNISTKSQSCCCHNMYGNVFLLPTDAKCNQILHKKQWGVLETINIAQ